MIKTPVRRYDAPIGIRRFRTPGFVQRPRKRRIPIRHRKEPRGVIRVTAKRKLKDKNEGKKPRYPLIRNFG